jgi:hypothetical protein
MNEVVKGIQCYGNSNDFEEHDALIIVHPWFGEGCSGQEPETYQGEFNRVLLEHRGKSNFVLMEMASNEWYQTAEKRLLPIVGRDRVFLVPTHGSLPDPAFTDWKGFADFLKQIKGEKFFAGGQYYPWGNEGLFAGCLAGAITNLKENGVEGKVLKEATFW